MMTELICEVFEYFGIGNIIVNILKASDKQCMSFVLMLDGYSNKNINIDRTNITSKEFVYYECFRQVINICIKIDPSINNDNIDVCALAAKFAVNAAKHNHIYKRYNMISKIYSFTQKESANDFLESVMTSRVINISYVVNNSKLTIYITVEEPKYII